MTSQEIEQQINTDFEKFQNEPYKGKPEVPENVLDLFRKGIKALPMQTHGILSNRIKYIVSKNPKELTVGDLNQVIKIIVCTPFAVIYSDIFEREEMMGIDNNDAFDEAINEQVHFEKFILSYNQYVSDFQEKLKMKKANLLSITSGVNNIKSMNLVRN